MCGALSCKEHSQFLTFPSLNDCCACIVLYGGRALTTETGHKGTSMVCTARNSCARRAMKEHAKYRLSGGFWGLG